VKRPEAIKAAPAIDPMRWGERKGDITEPKRATGRLANRYPARAETRTLRGLPVRELKINTVSWVLSPSSARAMMKEAWTILVILDQSVMTLVLVEP